MANTMFEQLRTARIVSDVRSARNRYVEACSRLPAAPIRIIERGEHRIIVATDGIPANTIVTAFAPDIVVYSQDGQHMAIDARETSHRLEGASLQHAVAHFSHPLVGFAPIVAIASDPNSTEITPLCAGALVGEVVDENPYASVLGIGGENPTWGDENVPALARVTAAIIERIASLSNVRIACRPPTERAPAGPTILMSVRPIAAGEQILSGRRPIFWMGDDARMAEAIYGELIRKTGETKNNELRIQIGLPPI